VFRQTLTPGSCPRAFSPPTPTILFAELGHKTLYSVSALASRSAGRHPSGLAPPSWRDVAAVLLGGATQPSWGFVRAITALTLIAMGLIIFFRLPEPTDLIGSAALQPGAGMPRCLNEWATTDRAAILAARYDAPAHLGRGDPGDANWRRQPDAADCGGSMPVTSATGARLRRFASPPRAEHG
jgi:hypothetical protein